MRWHMLRSSREQQRASFNTFKIQHNTIRGLQLEALLSVTRATGSHIFFRELLISSDIYLTELRIALF